MSKDGRVEGGRGLEVATRQDGTWLQFNASDGGACAIHIENLAKDRGPVTKEVLLRWCADQAKLAVAAPVPAGEREPAKVEIIDLEDVRRKKRMLMTDYAMTEDDMMRLEWLIHAEFALLEDEKAAPPLAESQGSETPRCPSCGSRDRELRNCMVENCGEIPHRKAICSDSWHSGAVRVSQGSEMPKFTDGELALLISMMNDRIIEAESIGIKRQDSSSDFRIKLLDKLTALRTLGAARVSEGSGEPADDDLFRRYRAALEGLTSGGPEFVGNPERCAQAMKDWQLDAMESVDRWTKRAQEAEAKRGANSSSPAGGRDERACFDKWSDGMTLGHGSNREAAWLGWQARAASSPRAEGGEKNV